MARSHSALGAGPTVTDGPSAVIIRSLWSELCWWEEGGRVPMLVADPAAVVAPTETTPGGRDGLLGSDLIGPQRLNGCGADSPASPTSNRITTRAWLRARRKEHVRVPCRFARGGSRRNFSHGVSEPLGSKSATSVLRHHVCLEAGGGGPRGECSPQASSASTHGKPEAVA